MNPQQILSQLKGIHSPPPVTWWPPAPGWWMLLLLIGVAGIVLWLYLRNRRNRNRYRRNALLLIDRIRDERRHNGDDKSYLEDMFELLRRAARQMAPHSGIETVVGAGVFIDTVSQYSPSLALDNSVRDKLDQWLYSATRIDEKDLDTFNQWAIDWVKSHRRRKN